MFRIILFILVFLASALGQAKGYNINKCIAGKKSINQCIDLFIQKSLPDKKWCGITPLNKDNKSEGLFVITINLESEKNTFTKEMLFLKKGTMGRVVSQAHGTWALSGRSVHVSYIHALAENQYAKFPTTLDVDFKDLVGDKLILAGENEEKSAKFGPITFQDCNSQHDLFAL